MTTPINANTVYKFTGECVCDIYDESTTIVLRDELVLDIISDDGETLLCKMKDDCPDILFELSIIEDYIEDGSLEVWANAESKGNFAPVTTSTYEVRFISNDTQAKGYMMRGHVTCSSVREALEKACQQFTVGEILSIKKLAS